MSEPRGGGDAVKSRREQLFWIAAGIGGCANCLQIGDEIRPIIKRLRKLHTELTSFYTGEVQRTSPRSKTKQWPRLRTAVESREREDAKKGKCK